MCVCVTAMLSGSSFTIVHSLPCTAISNVNLKLQRNTSSHMRVDSPHANCAQSAWFSPWMVSDSSTYGGGCATFPVFPPNAAQQARVSDTD